MGKGTYLGGGSLEGHGTIASEKRRKSGLGTSGAALREQRRVADVKRKAVLTKKIAATEEVVKQIGNEWAAEKGRSHFRRLECARQIKTSPLAAALHTALSGDDVG